MEPESRNHPRITTDPGVVVTSEPRGPLSSEAVRRASHAEWCSKFVVPGGLRCLREERERPAERRGLLLFPNLRWCVRRANPFWPWRMATEGWLGRFCCWQILRTLATVTAYNLATSRRAPTAPVRTVRNRLRLARLQRIRPRSPPACFRQVAVGEGVTSGNQQRCVGQYAPNRCSV